MTTDLRSRTKYLSLAFFSQKMARGLLDYLERGETPEIIGSFEAFLETLENVNRGQLPTFTQKHAALFTSYEHLRTLEEVWSADDKLRAAAAIKKFVQQPKGTPESEHEARLLLDLFNRLGSQARLNFEQPNSLAPKTIRELCQVD